MSLQVTNLKIEKVQAAEIKWNGAEIKASLNNALEDYRNLVVTEETLKGSKSIMAELNKRSKEIDDFRKKTVKTLNPDIKQFESEAKELVSMIKEARETIKEQVEVFIVKQREEKKEIVLAVIDAVSHEIELWDKYRMQVELKETYLNLSVTANKVREDVVLQFEMLKMLQDQEQQKIDTIKVIVDTYNNQLTFKFTYNEFDYLLESDITTISNIVKEKVIGRLEAEKAEVERLRIEKEKAVEKAKQEESARIRREEEEKRLAEERRHKEELDRMEFEKQKAISRAETNAAVSIQETFEQIEKITPTEPTEQEQLVSIELSILEPQHKIETLINYLESYGFHYFVKGE